MSTELDLAWLDPSCRDLTRREADGLGSGLSRAMAQRLGVDVIIVRVAFVVLALSAGLGLALYGWGTLLTRGPQGSRPIDALLPSFRTWSLGSQKAAVIITTLIFTFVVAASTPLPWGAGFLLLGVVIVVRRWALRGVRSPEPTGQELSVDAQLVAWRSRLEAAAGTTVHTVPELDLDTAPVVPAPAPPRARRSWLAGLAVLAAGGGVGAIAHFVAGFSDAVSLAAGVVAAGATAVVLALVMRTRRVPRLVLAALAVAVLSCGWLASQSGAGPAPDPGVLEISATATDETIDLGEADLTGVDEVVIRAVAADITVAVPGPVGELSSDLTLSSLAADPDVETDTGVTVLDRLVIDATASDVKVVRGE
ncbi:PspC domain-containing protein [Tessaracoccus lacteus]|uniref:PspC domain-containing protein n=1 Tax=Tessaracoccus lacteus TaxID=3041766 RepID=A0ABY8PVP0_9ACTN|nr:PspC domain-containing protein [Tessaracoccus sp. T21]WGT46528.1 PspC domain-containing protein [Tessaracoccus sp. T21]